MAVRKSVAGDAAGIASCVTAMYQYLRTKNALASGITNWTASTVQAFSAAGYDAFVSTSATGRIDAVCIYGIENYTRAPSLIPEKWMAIKILAVRAGIIAEADQETNSLRVLKSALPDAVSRLGCVGVVADFISTWTKLLDFVKTFAATEVEVGEHNTRIWYRFSTGMVEFQARTVGL